MKASVCVCFCVCERVVSSASLLTNAVALKTIVGSVENISNFHATTASGAETSQTEFLSCKPSFFAVLCLEAIDVLFTLLVFMHAFDTVS